MDSNPYAPPRPDNELVPGHPTQALASPYGPYRQLTGLARAILIVLSLGILAAAGHIYVIWAVTEANLLDRPDNGAVVALDRWVNLSAQINRVEILIRLVTIVLWCVWTNKSCKNAWLFRPAAPPHPTETFTPGWAVGWWFVPFLNLWKPFQVTAFIRDQVASAFKGGPILGIWWTGWIVTIFASAFLTRERDFESMAEVQAYNRGLMIDNALNIVASVLAGVVILTLTSAQQKTASQLGVRHDQI